MKSGRPRITVIGRGNDDGPRANASQPKLADTYLNLNKGCLSIRSATGADRGRVWKYAEAVEVAEARFVVQEGGRQRVIRNRCKEVHAWVRGVTRVLVDEGQDFGRLLAYWQKACLQGRALDVAYNPYYTPTFVVRDAGVPVYGAARVIIIGKRVFAVDAVGVNPHVCQSAGQHLRIPLKA